MSRIRQTFELAFMMVLGVLLGCLTATAAHAQDTSSTAITAVPLVQIMEPFIVAVLGAVVTAFLGWIASVVSKWTGINISAKHREALHSAAMTGVGFALAKAGKTAAEFKFDPKSRILKDATDWVYNSVPGAIETLGVDPLQLEKLVLSKITVMAETGVTPPPESIDGAVSKPIEVSPSGRLLLPGGTSGSKV